MITKEYALTYLKTMIGEEKDFRPGQWEAIEAVVLKKQRVLVVQRTGWGKSLVYLLATKLLREQGAGPTLLISPLLSLMRNQIEMANRMGIRAYSINSANTEKWEEIEQIFSSDECDIILISPERLNNDRFLNQVLPKVSGRIGLFVVDEAHCISDWGHDFRPDYRRIARILQILPKNVPVLGTTATANNRVTADVEKQLGPGLKTMRGPLARESLRLQNISLDSQDERLAWLAENLPKFKGSGIIYCLTVSDTKRVATWLIQKGFNAKTYYGDSLDRPALEQAFLDNEIKILVATVALGMGFDKPDVEFVIHFQRPGSVIAYYQQVGRAGRELDKSYGILLCGEEDDEIQNYFIDSAFPSHHTFMEILKVLESSSGMSISEILTHANVQYSVAEKALKLLELDGAIGQTYDTKVKYFRTPNTWVPDHERIERVLNLRREELAQMQAYMKHSDCLMKFLLDALDDPYPFACGRCANCKGKGLPNDVSPETLKEAQEYLRGVMIPINPRKYFPTGLFSAEEKTNLKQYLTEAGRALCYYGDAGWGELVRNGKYQDNHFSAELVLASSRLIRDLWLPEPFPEWVTAIPSNRRPTLVPDFAERLAKQLGIPYYSIIIRSKDAPEQKTMQNSFMQARNVIGTLALASTIPDRPVLLVDDVIDSGWTITMAGYLLRKNGSGQVFPFTLARASGRS